MGAGTSRGSAGQRIRPDTRRNGYGLGTFSQRAILIRRVHSVLIQGHSAMAEPDMENVSDEDS